MSVQIEIGQVLYDAPQRPGGDYRKYTVAKIGRKWATFFGGDRCTVDGLMLDYSPYGMRQLYIDKETHRQESLRNAAWRDFVRDVGNLRNTALSIEDINNIRRKLGLSVFAEAQP